MSERAIIFELRGASARCRYECPQPNLHTCTRGALEDYAKYHHGRSLCVPAYVCSARAYVYMCVSNESPLTRWALIYNERARIWKLRVVIAIQPNIRAER